MPLMTTPYFVYLAKIFCLNSAKNPISHDKWLLVYNVAMVATYVAILVLRACEPTYQFLELNQVVIHLQLVAYAVIFAANVTSNWTRSTTLYRNLLRLDAFDKSTNHRAAKSHGMWFWLALGFLVYVVATDLTVNLYVEESGNFFHWIAIFGPLVVNYASCVCAMASFELLHDRFASLETSVERMLTAKANGGGNVRRFANHFVDLTEAAEAMFGCFSPQIGLTCLATIVSVTNNIYLCLKVVDYMPLEYVTAVNFMALHVVEIGGVVYASHVTKLKSDAVVAKAAELLLASTNDDGSAYNDQMATTISTYLIIMLQFTSPNADATRYNTGKYSSTSSASSSALGYNFKAFPN